MDPISLGVTAVTALVEALPAASTMATAASVASAAGTAVNAVGQANALRAQAEADQLRAAEGAKWAERRSIEERAAAQSRAGQEARMARLAQSRLGAVAGASGSGASDPTVMKLWEGIGQEGFNNAANTQAEGDQRAQGMTYQAALDRWGADTNARIKRAAATNTLIGGMLDATGKGMAGLSNMAKEYRVGRGVGQWRTTVSTGYGG